MRNERFYRVVFLVAALWDLILGFVFFVFLRTIFSTLGTQVPENTSYAHLSAAFVFVQGLGYYYVYRNLRRNADIVRVGLVYKIVYTGVAFYYWAIGESPHLVFTAFGFVDLIFIALFLLYLSDFQRLFGEAAPGAGRPTAAA